MAGSRPRTPRRGVPTLCVPTLFLFLAYATLAATLRAETGHDAWLRYEPIKDTALLRSYDVVPALIYSLDDSEVEQSAQSELIRGISGMLGPRIQAFKGGVPEESCILLGTFDKIRAIYSGFTPPTDVAADGYLIKFMRIGAHDYLVITAPNDRGVLYGCCAKSAFTNPSPTSTSRRARPRPFATSMNGTTSTAPSNAVMAAAPSFGRRITSSRTSAMCAITRACWRRSASTAARSTM
jgi:hypothetical protein